ncbi:hypothetical protein F9B74_09970 [Pelistega sp. NLN82]|uniref:CdiA toxin EC869-like domain-containing protein n=1 Tax=Pelistega ratti TaxID=2652177 RepID=A0A6L9Y804_9BURK|nr:hypothetical protein [Pelistega ratti]NEN76630.1 hypothetical protein [Pelistega ratti]
MLSITILTANTPQLNPEARKALQQATAIGIGALAGAVIGDNKTAIQQGALASFNVEKYNRQLHPEQMQRIVELANGDEDKQQRLEIAACALMHCSAQIPEDDPDYAEAYAKAKALEDLGNTPEYALERQLLRQQKLSEFVPIVGSITRPLFTYEIGDGAIDYADKVNTKYAVTTRAGGALQAVGGGASVAAGATLCKTGIGCIVGVPVGSYGIDNITAGISTVIKGKTIPTVGAQLLSNITGLSTETSEMVYGLPSMLTGGLQGIRSTATIGKGIGQFLERGKLNFTNEVINNKTIGIQWGKGIANQGKPWEAYVHSKLPQGAIDLNRIKSNFKVFDHWLPDGTAISSKTINTGAKTYQNPANITRQLNKYVDDMVNFRVDRKGDFILTNEKNYSKRNVSGYSG